MRTVVGLAVVAIFAFPGTGRCQQQAQSSSQTSASAAAPAPTPQPDSLADAARKAREQHKESTKAAKVFTNDNLPTTGVSTVGPSSAETETPSESTATNATKPPAGKDEKAWRDKFAALRHKLEQDQTELGVMQREANVDQVEFYNGDPMKAQQDRSSGQPLGAEYNKKVADIDAKQKQIEADQQAISDAEDDLHKAGGDSGWAR